MELAAITVVVVGVVVVCVVNRYLLESEPLPSEDVLVSLQARLLDAIQEASADHGLPFDIRPALRGCGYNRATQNEVIQRLIKSHNVKVKEEFSYGAIVDVWRWITFQPPTHLVLTDRTWIRMVVERMNGTMIVMGDYRGVTQGNGGIYLGEGAGYQSSGRDIIQSPITTGRVAKVETGDATVTASAEAPTLELLAALVAALRTEAPQLPDRDRQRQVREVANELERAAHEEPRADEEIKSGLRRATQIVREFGSFMTASNKLLDLLPGWTN